MADLWYITNTSVDGYIEDLDGRFDWSAPDDEVHGFINDLLRDVGTHLYGRRLYETMAVWETEPALAEGSPFQADFAELWQAADKAVFSSSLADVWTAKTQLERRFDPESIRQRKASATQPLFIGGANLAAQAVGAGVVDEYHVFVLPVVIGAGKPALTTQGQIDLELIDHRRFTTSGTTYQRYRIQR